MKSRIPTYEDQIRVGLTKWPKTPKLDNLIEELNMERNYRKELIAAFDYAYRWSEDHDNDVSWDELNVRGRITVLCSYLWEMEFQK